MEPRRFSLAALVMLASPSPAFGQLRVEPCAVTLPSHGGTYLALVGCVEVENPSERVIALEATELELVDSDGNRQRLAPVLVSAENGRPRRALSIRPGARVRVLVIASARVPEASFPRVVPHVVYTQIVHLRVEGREIVIERPGWTFRYPRRR